jgi:uncharacterized protein
LADNALDSQDIELIKENVFIADYKLKNMYSEDAKKHAEENVREFKEIIKDIAENDNVSGLKDHEQHHHSTRYAHCEAVAFYTYLLCKRYKLDYISATRGAMLHDFYFYNWRNKHVEGQKKFHLFRHPKIALQNAEDLFELNDMEKDIIVKHMWPITIIPPKFKEGYIVTLVDKYCATRDFFKTLKVQRKLKLLVEKNEIKTE